MKLISLAEFIQLPEGTIFQQFWPAYFGSLSVKGVSFEESNDFLVASLTVEYIQAAQFGDPEKKDDVIQFQSGFSRWGEYDNTAMFLVYEDTDCLKLADWLTHPQKAAKVQNNDSPDGFVVMTPDHHNMMEIHQKHNRR